MSSLTGGYLFFSYESVLVLLQFRLVLCTARTTSIRTPDRAPEEHFRCHTPPSAIIHLGVCVSLESRPSFTAELAAAMRATEQARPQRDRIIDDPYARRFITDSRLRAVTSASLLTKGAAQLFDRLFPGILTEALLRSRYVDEAMTETIDNSPWQVVLLGTGYDTTALRHTFGDRVRLFEVDHPSTLRAKLSRLRTAGLDHTAEVTYVPCDFARQSIAEVLREHGHDDTVPSFISWLAVTMYLPAESVAHTLDEIRTFCAPGSRLLFDYMDSAVINGTTTSRGAQRAAKNVARRGEPYIFGLTMDQIPEWAEKHQYTMLDHSRIRELLRRYDPRGKLPHSTEEFMGLVTLAT